MRMKLKAFSLVIATVAANAASGMSITAIPTKDAAGNAIKGL